MHNVVFDTTEQQKTNSWRLCVEVWPLLSYIYISPIEFPLLSACVLISNLSTVGWAWWRLLIWTASLMMASDRAILALFSFLLPPPPLLRRPSPSSSPSPSPSSSSPPPPPSIYSPTPLPCSCPSFSFFSSFSLFLLFLGRCSSSYCCSCVHLFRFPPLHLNPPPIHLHSPSPLTHSPSHIHSFAVAVVVNVVVLVVVLFQHLTFGRVCSALKPTRYWLAYRSGCSGRIPLKLWMLRRYHARRVHSFSSFLAFSVFFFLYYSLSWLST